MAERDTAVIELQLKINQALAEIDKLNSKIATTKTVAKKTQSELSSSFGNISGKIKDQLAQPLSALSAIGFNPAVIGLTSLTAALGKAVSEAADAEKTFRSLTLSVEKSGSRTTAENFKEIAGALSEVTVLDDDEILRDVTNNLLKFDSVANSSIDKFKEIQKAVIDISAKEEIPLANVAEALGVALEQPAEKLSLLNRQLKIFNKDELEAVEALAKNNRLLDAQQLILDKVNSKYKGFSENFKNSFDGKKAEAIRNINDSLQAIGEVALPIIAEQLDGVNLGLKSMMATATLVSNSFSSMVKEIKRANNEEEDLRNFYERRRPLKKGEKPLALLNQDDVKKDLDQADKYFGSLLKLKEQAAIKSSELSSNSLLNEGKKLAAKKDGKGSSSGSIGDAKRERDQFLKDEEEFQKKLAEIRLKNSLDSGVVDRLAIEKKIRSEQYDSIGKNKNKLKASDVSEIEKRIKFLVDEESVVAYEESIRNVVKSSDIAIEKIKGDSKNLSNEQIAQINQVANAAIESSSSVINSLNQIMNSTVDESLKVKIQEILTGINSVGSAAKKADQETEDLSQAFANAFRQESLGLQNIQLLKDSLVSVAGALTDALFEGKKFSDTLADLGKNILKTITNMLLMKSVEKGLKSLGFAEGGMVPAFADGGYNANFSGRQIPTHAGGTGTSDSIKARLSAGEFVVNRQTVDNFGAGFFYKLQELAKNKKSGINLKTGGHIAPPKIKNNVVHLASGGMARSNGLINNFAVNVVNRGEPKNVTDRQVDPQTGVVTIVLDDIKNNGAISNAIAGTFGLKR